MIRTKEVELPSGRKVTIKAPGPYAMLAFSGALPTGRLAKLRAGEDVGEIEIDQERWRDTLALYYCACVVTPQLTITEPTPAGKIHIDDFTQEDFTALIKAIQGMGQADAEKLRPLSAAGNPG